MVVVGDRNGWGGGGGEGRGRSQEDLFSFSLGQFGWPYPGKAHQPQEQRQPFLPVCSIFMSLNNGMAASVSDF